MQTFRKLLLGIFCILLLFQIAIPASFAQTQDNGTTLGVARIVLTKDKNIKDGNILSSGDQNGAILSQTPYDSQVLGVVSRDAAILLNTGGENGVPVVSVGTVYVLVSTINGVIKKGDLITTSTTPGIGAKALKSGYVLGTALEDYNNPDPKKTQSIAVDLNLHYFNAKPTLAGTLTDIFKIALLPTKDSPAAIYKYIIAGVVTIGSFVLGFLTFGRTAAKGVEALGRNPAATKIIHLGIIFNVTIVVFIVLAGLTVSFLILRL